MQVVNIPGLICVFSLRSVNRTTECFLIHVQVVGENLQPLMLTDFTSQLRIYIFLYLKRANVFFSRAMLSGKINRFTSTLKFTI